MKNDSHISKLICYWLRHNPNDADLQMDEQGWVNLELLLQSLQNKQYDLSRDQLIALNKQFDKQRWEVTSTHIRATHGHSLPVHIESTSCTPPEILYHGTAIHSVAKILKDGINKMSRSEVHLSEYEKDALQVGRRHGTPFIIEVYTEELLEQGWTFRKSANNIWLTQDIPPSALGFEPWEIEQDDERKKNILIELKKELHPEHPLFEEVNQLQLIWTNTTNDDELFQHQLSGKCYRVHLTWTGKQEQIGFPVVDTYSTFDEWITNGLLKDQQLFYL